MRRAGVSALWAVAGGVAWGACHAARPAPALAAVALVPLVLIAGGPRPGRFGWLHGVVSWCAAIPWIVPTVTTYGQLDGWIGGLALVAIGVMFGLFHGLFAFAGARLWRRGDALSLAGLAGLWTALEAVRAVTPLDGFPWNLAAYAWTELPGALPLASWIGAYGVSALVVIPNLGVARSLVRRDPLPAAFGVALAAIALAVGARFAPPPPVDPSGRVASVAVVQPNTPNRPFFDAAASLEDYRRLLRQTDEVCAPGRLVVWPESAAWPRDWQSDAVLRADVAARTATGCSILLNSPHTAGERVYNSVLLAAATATASDTATASAAAPARADKRHLVPFGEFVPGRRWLPFLGRIARGIGDFSPAERIATLPWGRERLGVAVCFEVIFPGETAALVRSGATVLATVTNDAWYGDTAAPHQHLRAARFRAAENRRWLVRAAITGISAVVRPDGSLAGELGVDREGTIVTAVVGRDDRSPYARAPWLVPALGALLAAAAAWRVRRSRGSPAGVEAAAAAAVG